MVSGGWSKEFIVDCQYLEVIDAPCFKTPFESQCLTRTTFSGSQATTIRVSYREAIKLGWKETSTSLWYCPDHAHHA